MNNISFKVNNKDVNIYYKESIQKEIPVIILNNFDNNGEKVFNKCQELEVRDFILVSISNINWNDDLTPWKSDSLFKNDKEYLGNADNYLKEIEKDIIPKIEDYVKKIDKKIDYYALVGYSLAGLFSLYSSFNTNIFTRIGCVSASLWYPNFVDYVKNNQVSYDVSKIYFSLGNREKYSKIELLSTVLDKTLEIYNYLNDKVNCIYEENIGNHFKDEELRVAKCIKWLLN